MKVSLESWQLVTLLCGLYVMSDAPKVIMALVLVALVLLFARTVIKITFKVLLRCFHCDFINMSKKGGVCILWGFEENDFSIVQYLEADDFEYGCFYCS
jgi:hypothetical protein